MIPRLPSSTFAAATTSVLMPFSNMSKSSNGYVQTTALPMGMHFSDDVQLEDFNATVADKWQGTVADKHDMVMLGRSQVLRVSLDLALIFCSSLAETYRRSGISASSLSSVSRPSSYVPGSLSSREHSNSTAMVWSPLTLGLLGISSSLSPTEAPAAFSGDSQ